MGEHKLDIRGITRVNILEYFNQVDGAYQKDNLIYGDNWEIEIGQEQQYRIGALKLPLVELTFRMEEEDYQSMLKNFISRFSCMGG